MWIEIGVKELASAFVEVTLHTEGVDRNSPTDYPQAWEKQSPSTRRVWIEMLAECNPHTGKPVTLHTEGVDRNWSDYCGWL